MPNTNTTVLTANNSNGSTKQLSYKVLHRVQLSDQPKTYVVHIEGKGNQGQTINVSWTYNELHPLMALGRAVLEYSSRYICASVNNWRISEFK